MDGFDDLLKQSRSALEDNPFEDPFAKPRSNSPDPWSSNYLGTSSAQTDDFGTSSAFATDTPSTAATSIVHDDERSTTPTTESQPFTSSAEPADPLDLANANLSSDEDEPSKPSVKSPRSYGFRESVESDHEPPSASSSSGFKESIEPETKPEPQSHPKPQPVLSPLSPAVDSPISPSPHSPTTRRPSTPSTVSVTSPVFAPGTSTSDSEPASPPISARLPQRQTSRPSAMDATPHLGTPTPQTRNIISPLEQQQGSLDRSFANLALGGEGFSGGWDEGAQSTFVGSSPVRPPEEEEEDDDDDKPLRPRPTESVSILALGFLGKAQRRLRLGCLDRSLQNIFLPHCLVRIRVHNQNSISLWTIHRRSGIPFVDIRCTPFTLAYVHPSRSPSTNSILTTYQYSLTYPHLHLHLLSTLPSLLLLTPHTKHTDDLPPLRQTRLLRPPPLLRLPLAL